MIALKRSLYPILALIVLTAGFASAQPRNAQIVLAGRELVLSPRPVVDDGKVFAPIQVLDQLGCTYAVDQSKHIVSIINSDLEEKTVRTVALGNNEMLPMAKVVDILGGTTTWNEFARVLNVYPLLKSVEFVNSQLIINLSISAPFKITYWPNPDRLAVDISGTKVDTAANEVSINDDDVIRARIGQFDEQTARVVLDLSRRVGYRIHSEPVTNRIEIEVNASIQQSDMSVAAPPRPKVVTVNNITADAIPNDRLRISIPADGKLNAKIAMLRSPLRLTIDLPDSKLAVDMSEIAIDHPLVDKIRVGQQSKPSPSLRLVLDTTRYLAHSVISSDENGLTLDVRLPHGAGGRLSEKIIVIDPGHGGPQKGASHDGVHEKTLNLEIAKKVARRLEAVGAKAILTRDGDYNLDPSLGEDLRKRPAVATNQGADLFVSIHCNALGVPNPPSGVETYYHQSLSDSYALASAVHNSILAGTKMNDREVRSDSKLHGPKGLAVLRNSTVPAILIESGYLDNQSDRSKLVNPDFQEKFAAALVEGLRVYVEGNKTGGSQ